MRILLLLLLSSVLTFAEDLRVLTFNIRMNTPRDGQNAWPHRKEAVAKLIDEHADIAGLQEVKPEQRAWLLEKLPQFAFLGIGRVPDDKDESVPVVYRKDRFEVLSSGTFWLSETPDVPGSTHWGNELPRVCSWARLRDKKAGQVLYFYNVHLDHQSANARLRGLQQVADHIAKREGGEPAVLVGDFNSSSAHAPLKAIAERDKPALISTYQALGVPEEGTFHGFTGKPGHFPIDYILVEKNRWQVKSGAVLKTTYRGEDGTDRFVSDHFPVDAVLSYPSPKPAAP